VQQSVAQRLGFCAGEGWVIVQPVFDAGVAAVSGIEPGVLACAGVGGEAGVAPAVSGLDQVELRAGVRALTANDDPYPGRGSRRT
jgi:hypothetical protein